MGVRENYKKMKESENSFSVRKAYNQRRANEFASGLNSRLDALYKMGDEDYETYKSRFLNENGEYIGVDNYRDDSVSSAKKFGKRYSTVKSEYEDITSNLEKYKDYFDEKTVSEITDYLNGYKDTYSSMKNVYDYENDYFSRWEDKDAFEYDKRLRTSDLNAVNSEVSTISSDLAYVQRQHGGITSDNVFTYLLRPFVGEDEVKKKKEENEQRQRNINKILQKYGVSSIEELEELASEKEAFLNNATRVQKGIKLAGVSDPNSEYYDPEFESKSAVNQYATDAAYKYINDIGGFKAQQDDLYVKSEATTGYEQVRPWYMDYNSNLHQLTETELKTYNYYFNQYGAAKAKEYIDSIQETLNAREAGDIIDSVGDSKILKEIFAVSAGLDQFEQGVNGLFSSADYIPTSATQMASGQFREDLHDAGWGWGVAYDLLNTTANMAPSILVSTAVGFANPVAGAVAGNTLMGASAAGNARAQAINRGYSKDQANMYGVLVGGSEALLQYALGGIGSLGGKGLSKTGLKMLSGVDGAFWRTAGKLGGKLGAEALEESLQEVLNPYFENLALNANNDWSDIEWGQVAYSGLLGALSAGMLEGVSTIGGEVGVYQSGKTIRDAGLTADLVEFGKTFAEGTEAFNLAGKIDENTGAYTVGRLLEAVGPEGLSASNIADVKAQLEKRGVAPMHASTIAKWVDKAARGTELTTIQRMALEMNEDVNMIVNDIITNKHSSVNQRVAGYDSITQQAALYVAMEEVRGKIAKAEKKAKKSDTAETMPESVSDDAAKMDTIPVAENRFEVSETGETINTKTGESVKVAEIATIQDGEVTLRLEDGSTVSADDVSFASNDEGLLYSVVADMGISTEAANQIINAFDPTKQSASVYTRGIQEAYTYGRFNYNDETLFKRGLSSYLTEEQRKIAYDLGKIDEKARVEAQQAEIDAKKKTVKEGAKKGVHYEGDKLKLDKTRRTSLTVMEEMADKFGLSFYVYESFVKDGKYYYKDANGKIKHAPHGKYDTKTGAIYVDLNAGNFGAGTMLYTVAHELGHHIKEWSPAKFKALADFLVEQYEAHGVTVDNLVHKQIKKAADNDRTLTYDEAFEEFVCDSLETMLTDGNLENVLAKLKAKDKGLWNAIKNFFAKWAKTIREVYAKFSPTSKEGQIVAKWKDTIEQIQALFFEGLADASGNFSAAVSNSNEVVFGKTDISEDIGETERGVKNQLREHKKIGEKAVSYNNKHSNVIASVLETGIEVMSEMAEAMIPFLDQEGILPPDIPGKTIFSNGSYGRSGENTTLCVRTLTYEDFKDRVSEKIGRPLTVSESLLVSQKIYDIAVEPQCIYCYVAADRKAYDAYLGEYWDAMDKYIKALRSGGDSKTLYTEYLDGRKDTDAQKKRWAAWEAIAKSGKEYISSKDLTTKRKRDAIVAKKNAFSEQVKDAQKYAQSASWAKKVFDYRAYKGDILRMTSTLVEALNSEYGLRMYSFSDYTPAFIVENMQMLIDASVKGLKSLAYTKDTDYAEIFASTGQAINVSCFARYDSILGDYVEDSRQGANWEKTKQLRKKHSNVGAVMVCTNDAMVEWALKQDWVDVVIPYHIVKTGTTIANEYGWNNYTSESADKDGNKVANIYPTEHNNDFATYSKLLGERGITPRFSSWYDKVKSGEITEQQYMKLVNEVRLPASKLHPVVPVFDIDAAKRSFGIKEDGSVISGGFVDKGGYMGGWYRQGVDVNQEVMQVSEDIAAGKSSLEVDYGMSKAGKKKVAEKYGEKLQDRTAPQLDADYMKSVKSGDESVQQKFIDEAARRAGFDTEHLYHGTGAFGFTVADTSFSDDGISFFLTNDPAVAESYFPYKSGEGYHDNIRRIGKKVDGAPTRLSENADVESVLERVKEALPERYDGARAATEEEVIADLNDFYIPQMTEAATELLKYDVPADVLRLADAVVEASEIGTYEAWKSVTDRYTEFFDIKEINDKQGRYWYQASDLWESIQVSVQKANDLIHYGAIVRSSGHVLSKKSVVSEYNDKLKTESIGIYDVYTKRDNQLTIAGCGSNWNNIPLGNITEDFNKWWVEEQGHEPAANGLWTTANTRSISQYAKDRGYRSVHFDGITDMGSGSSDSVVASVYSYFYPNEDVKSADPVTYDDNGDVIPPSKRFDSADKDFRYSERDYSYDALVSKPDMPLTIVGGAVPTSRADIVAAAKKNAAKVGKFNPKDGSVSVYVDDVGTDVIVTKKSLVHGLDRRTAVQAPVLVKVGEILKNAVRINKLMPRANEVDSTYVLIGAARDEGGSVYVASFVVNSYSNEITEVDVLYSANAKKESAAFLPKFTNKVATPTDSAISIADLLDYVNKYFPDILPEDVLKHYGHDSRPKGDIGESALYQDRDPEAEAAYRDISKHLEKENAELREDVERLRELLKLQRTVTHGKMFNKTSLEAVAGKIMRYANANGEKSEFVSRLTDVYSYILNGEDVSWEGIKDKAQDAVEWLRSHEKHERQRDEYADEVLAHLRGLRISLDEQQKQEVAHLFGSYNNFRQKMMGKVIIANDGIQLDSVWQELCEQYPSFFDSDVVSNDQPMTLMDIVNDLQNSYVEDYYYEDEMVAHDLVATIYDEYWNVSTLHTLADTQQRKINSLKNKHKESIDELRETHREKVKDLRKKAREDVVNSRKKGREAAERDVAKKRLKNLILETSKWVATPKKDDVKCPDILRAPYAEFLQAINFSSERYLKTGEYTKEDLRLIGAFGELAEAIKKIQDGQKGDGDVSQIESGYLDLPEDFADRLRKIAGSLKKLMAGQEISITQRLPNGEVRTETHSVGSDFIVNRMSLADVKSLTLIVRTLNHSIREIDNVWQNHVFENATMLGEDTVSFLEELGAIDSTNAISDFVNWKNGLPYFVFKRFGKGGESIFEEFMDAQDKLAFLADKILKFREKAWTDEEVREWSEEKHTIELSNGKSISLTTTDIMSIYCLARRDNQQGLKHLVGGGIRVAGKKNGAKTEADVRVNLNLKDVQTICSLLDKRQQAVAESIQEFMSTVCGGWGNEISMKRFLQKQFTEARYFPIETSDESRAMQDPQKQQSDLFRLLNISATKELTPNANNAVIIRNIFDVFAAHTSDMAKLNAFGFAMLDAMKWLNYSTTTKNDEGQVSTRGVRQQMHVAYGDEARSYILNLIKDINGRFNDNGDHPWLLAAIRGAKTAMVGGNLRVAALQFTAFPRAAMVLPVKHLAKGFRKLPQISMAKKYCGIALWKSMGFYDTNITRGIEEQIKGGQTTRQKLIELSLKGAEWGDAITWGWLWNACESAVAEANPKLKVGTEEFYQEVGKKLREVVYSTQVVDSVLTRSHMMRSKSGLMQTATAFMSEPTLTTNILTDAFFQFSLEKRRFGSAKMAWKKTCKHIGTAIAVYSVGQIFAALMEGLADAWRDDDDDEFMDKFWMHFGENFVTDIIPLNKIPIASEGAEMLLSKFGIGWFSSERMEMTQIQDASDAIDAWLEIIKGDSSYTVYNAIYKTTKTISTITGIPFGGEMREAVTLWNNTAGAADPYLKIRTYHSSRTDVGIAEFAFDSGNTADVKRTVEKMIEEKKEDGKSEKEAKSAVKSTFTSNFKEDYVAAAKRGDTNETGRIRKILHATGLYGSLSELDDTLKNWRKSAEDKK